MGWRGKEAASTVCTAAGHRSGSRQLKAGSTCSPAHHHSLHVARPPNHTAPPAHLSARPRWRRRTGTQLSSWPATLARASGVDMNLWGDGFGWVGG